MIAVWVLLAAVALVGCYFILKVVRKLSRTMGALVKSMEDLGEVAVELQRLKGEVRGPAAPAAPADEVKEQNGSVDDNSRQ